MMNQEKMVIRISCLLRAILAELRRGHYVGKLYYIYYYITPVPKFILNLFRGLIEDFNCLAFIYKPPVANALYSL